MFFSGCFLGRLLAIQLTAVFDASQLLAGPEFYLLSKKNVDSLLLDICWLQFVALYRLAVRIVTFSLTRLPQVSKSGG